MKKLIKIQTLKYSPLLTFLLLLFYNLVRDMDNLLPSIVGILVILLTVLNVVLVLQRWKANKSRYGKSVLLLIIALAGTVLLFGIQLLN